MDNTEFKHEIRNFVDADMESKKAAWRRLSEMDTSNVDDMSNLRLGDNFDEPINFNTSQVNNMSGMFYGCENFNQPLDFNTSQVENMSGMFNKCRSFNQPLDFNTSQVTNMNYMFFRCESFNQNLTHWDVFNVKNIEQMFRGCPIRNIFKPVFPEEGESRESYNARREAKMNDTAEILNIEARIGFVVFSEASKNATQRSDTGKAMKLFFNGSEKSKVMQKIVARFSGDSSGNSSGGKSRRSKSRKLRSRSKKSKSKKKC